MVQRTKGVSHWEFGKLHFQDNDLTNTVSWWWRPKESLKSSMLWIKTQSSQRPSQKGSRDWGTHSPWWGHLLIWILPESNIHLSTPMLALTPGVIMAEILTATPWSLEAYFAETQSQRTQLRLWTSEGHLCQEAKPGGHPLTLHLLFLQTVFDPLY